MLLTLEVRYLISVGTLTLIFTILSKMRQSKWRAMYISAMMKTGFTSEQTLTLMFRINFEF